MVHFEERAGDYCRHSETGVIPQIKKMGRQASHNLLEKAVHYYRKGQYGNALMLLKIVKVRGHQSRRFRRLYAKVNTAIQRTVTH